MKLGIITQRIGRNYGGTIQNYALQQALIRLGHTPVTMMLERPMPSRLRIFAHFMIDNIKRIFGVQTKLFPSRKIQSIIYKNTQGFVDKYVSIQVLKNYEFRMFVQTNKVEGLVVGSDQVWRPKYNDSLFINYLGFSENMSLKRISYAASFGVDTWEYTEEQTANCKKLIKNFDAVSVREKSAVSLCEKYFGVSATYVLDPTLLLDKEDYRKLIMDKSAKSNKMMFVYLLDKRKEKKEVVENIAKNKGLEPYFFMPSKSVNEIAEYSQLNECVYSPIEDWLDGFDKCKYVVCDSFHGTVFSIIFNKPFSVITNNERGNTRFESLLETFKLQDRLISNNSCNFNCSDDIDWNIVNNIKDNMKELSLSFLKETLNR